jgi:DNA repair protein RecO (recombination protein O)
LLYQTEGIVLALNELAEHDRVVTILTRDEGVVKAVVKGARKPLSKLSAVTQPYSASVFQLFRGRSLDRVTQVALKTSHPGIMLDYDKMVYTGLLAELVFVILPEREIAEDVFVFFGSVLREMELRDDPWPVAVWGTLGILARTGFAPSFGACVVCGEAPAPSSNLYFSAEAGGVICAKCRGLSPFPDLVREISPGAARTLDMLSASAASSGGPAVNARGRVRDESMRVLLDYVMETLGRRLNSASLVERIEVEAHHKE